jgi:DNA polymerase-3 subunit epsilon
MEFVVVDLETTGLSPKKSRVIEVGAVIINDSGDILATFQSLCSPDPANIRVSSQITKITGITSLMLQNQPSTATIMEKFYDFIGKRPLIAHNAAFDSKFLSMEMGKINKTVWNPFLCTLLLSRRLLKADKFNLTYLKDFINFQSEPGRVHKDHRALDDALVTVKLFSVILHRLVEITGPQPAAFLTDTLRTISALTKEKVKTFLSPSNECSNKEPKHGQTSSSSEPSKLQADGGIQKRKRTRYQ